MNMNHLNINDKQLWAEESGLLPIHLSPVNEKEQYIMLDGGLYDFCLDLSGEDIDESKCYSAAWSSDVKNYISIHKEHLEVFNWSRRQKEKVKLSVVKDKFQSFFQILNSTCYRTSDDITPFILGLFAQIRNLTQERKEPVDALNLLFKLLVSLDDEHLSQETCNKWGILNVPTPCGFEILLKSIREGVRHITPNLDYILRHGSGPLFETAHREAVLFDTQLNLFGEVSSNLSYAAPSKYTGVHYTPRFLVRSIVENVLKRVDLKRPALTILDPACGSGSFLQEILKQLREKRYNGQITLRGFDVSSMAEHTARFLLNYENRSQWDNRLVIEIVKRDSLSCEWGINDIILMNPPFISSELIKDSDVKELVNDVLSDLKMKKRPNMAAAFVYKAFQSLSDDGIIGAVLPSSILVQEQYEGLRDAACQLVKLEVVAQLGNFVFSEALADTSFIIAQKRVNEVYTPLNIWCSNRERSAFDAIRGWRKMQYDNASQRINENYNIYIPSHFPIVKNTWKVLPQDDDDFLHRISLKNRTGDLKPLSYIFDVHQGVLKGNKDLFEIDKEQFLNLPKSEKRLFRPMASSRTIMSGFVKGERYIWYPYSVSGLLIQTEDELRKYEWAYNWLLPHKEHLLSRKGVSLWWDLTRSRSSLFCQNERLLCSKRSGGSHSFAIAPEGYVVEEGNVFILKKGYCEEDRYFYLSYFSSMVFQRMLGIYARPLKAGYDLGKIQIKDIPILDVACMGIRESFEYKELVRLGKEYSEGYVARRELFDQYVKVFY